MAKKGVSGARNEGSNRSPGPPADEWVPNFATAAGRHDIRAERSLRICVGHIDREQFRGTEQLIDDI